MTSNKSKSIVGLFILIFVLFIIFMIFAFYTVASLKSSNISSRTSLFKKASNAPIAVIPIEGVIMDSRKTVERLLEVEKDESIKAIILRIDSPGGAVAPTQEIYEEVIRIDKEKPIYASFGSVAASGGYYVGAATRKIFSNGGTLTGSIGVIMQFVDMSKLYEFAKLKPETIKAGKYKDIGSPSRSMSPQEKELMDNVVAGVHVQFIDDILKRRKSKIKGEMIEHAQGQIFSGKKAKDIGLVDEIAGLWEAGRAIHDELKLEGEFGLRFIEKNKRVNLMDLLENVDESISQVKKSLKSHFAPTFMYQ